MPLTYEGVDGPKFSEKEAYLSQFSKSTGLTHRDHATGIDYSSEYAMREAQWNREHPGQS